MNYSAMIQNRKSVHAFREKEVPSEAIGQLRSYYEKACPRLVPEIATELIVSSWTRMHSRRWRAQRAISNFSSEHRTTCSLCLPRIPMRPSTPAT